jgi:hypothetical protein
MKCHEHPGYLAHEPPFIDCSVCRLIWARKVQNEQVLAFRFAVARPMGERLPKGKGELRPPDTPTQT